MLKWLKRKKLSNEANELFDKFEEDLDLSIVTSTYSFENVTDFNMSNLYKLLSEKEEFKNSKKI